VGNHVFADIDAANFSYIAAQGFGDGSRAAGIVEEADFSCKLLFLFLGCGPLGSEPFFTFLEGIADLLRYLDLPGFGVVGRG
jgi:hypothetical protein